MFGYEPLIVLGMAIAVMLGGVVKGVTAIGLPIVTMVIVINFVPPQTALALITVPLLVTNIWQAMRAGDWVYSVRRFWPLMITFIGCLYIGTLIAASVASNTLFMLIGVAVIIFTGSQLVKPTQEPLGPAAQHILGPLAGALGGILGGISTIWGPPMMMYLFMLHMSKDQWARSVGTIWLMGAIPLTLFYWQNGVLHPGNIWLSVGACVPGMIGILIGERIRGYVNEEKFRKVLLIALLIVGLNLIRRAVM